MPGCRLYAFFTSFQVELRGHCSVERIRALNKYFLTTSTLRALLNAVLSPLPCLVVVVLVDSVSLDPPEAGSRANMKFWGRNYLSLVLMTFAIIQQLRVVVPGLNITAVHNVVIPIIPSASGVAFMFLLASIVGFPLPFTLVVGVPPWIILLSLSFVVCFGRVLKQDALLRKELIDYVNVLNCPVFLHFVYPIYLYGFTHVGAFWQNVYLSSLILIKVIARNVMSYHLGTKYDLMSQVVIFNVDVFNSVYVSNSMQNSKSMSTMLVMIAIDAGLAWISMRDIQDLVRNVVMLQRQIPTNHPMKHATFIEITLQIIQEDERAVVHLSQQHYSFGLASLRLSAVGDCNGTAVGPMAGILAKPSKQILPNWSLVVPDPSVEVIQHLQYEKNRDGRNFGRVFPENERHEFVRTTAQVLFTLEFISIIFYTKAVVPFIFATSTTARFFMSNRAYYPQLKDLTEADFKSQMSRVALLGAAEVIIVLVASFVIQRRLGIPLLRLLSFVLDHGRVLVQSNLFLPIFYTVQNSLEHNGADFSWSFSWLKHTSDHTQ